MTWFRGQKIVCVYNGTLWNSSTPELELGKVYTVDRQNDFFGVHCVVIAEQSEPGFYFAERFRPVVEPELPESITACLTTDHKLREPALT